MNASIQESIEALLAGLCEDCDGRGYTETGGMAMEDDLVERWPCDNPLHSKETVQKFLTLVEAYTRQQNRLARIDELQKVDTFRHYGKDYQDSMDELAEYKEKRLIALQSQEGAA